MRTITHICLCLLLIAGLGLSCNKTNFNYPDGYVGRSKITNFADLSMSGNPYMSIVKGSTWTDPGVTATQSGKTLPVTISGTVDNNTVGFYTLSYSAVNSDGFPASITRTVAVIPSAEPPGTDLSGDYIYVSTGANDMTITKLAPGFYSTTNCWSSATTIPVLFICSDGTNIIVPSQSTPYGPVFGTGTLAPSGALTFVISIPNSGLSNSNRHWQAN